MFRAGQRARRAAATSAAIVFFTASLRGQAPEQWYVTPGSGTTTQRSGFSLSIDGDRMVTGAPYDDTSASNCGCAHVYRWDAPTDSWVYEQQLLPSDAEATELFGWSVSIEGNLIVVGAPNKNTTYGNDGGQAYVFRLDATTQTWNEEQILLPSSGSTSDFFGNSVAVSGDLVLVGVPNCDTTIGLNSGAAFVFRYKNPTLKWLEETQLLDSDGYISDGAGWSVDLDGTTAVVASYRSDEGSAINAGSVEVWSVSGTTWTAVQELDAGTPQGSAEFGTRVRLDGDLLGITAPAEDVNALGNAGAAYLFRRSAGLFSEEERFVSPVPTASEKFGSDVAVSDDLVLVGSALQNTFGRSDSGAAHLYRHSNKKGWVHDQQLGASDAAVADRLGAQVGLHSSMLIATADGNDLPSKSDQGVVYGYVWEEITLTIDPATPAPGQAIALDAFRGPVGSLVLITIEDVSGTPLFLPLLVTTFGTDNTLSLSASAPNPALGFHVGLRAYRKGAFGPLVFSDLAYVDV